MPDITKQEIRDLIGENAVILDIGCYDGTDAAELSEVCNSDVHCFECSPVAIEKFKAKGHSDRLTLWPYAVTSHHGFCVLNQSHSDKREKQSASSLVEPKKHKKIWPDVTFKEKIKVSCTTLDSWHFIALKDKPIDFIWCDVNGAESQFILGGVRALAKTKYLYIEFCEVELFERALNKERMKKALPGFEEVGVYNLGANFGNMLLRNKNIENI